MMTPIGPNTVNGQTTNYALDIGGGLPEVIYTSQSEVYPSTTLRTSLHLPGVIVTQKATEVRYLLSDGLGSIRHAVDETATIVAYHEFDPYGNPVVGEGDPYGYTGEWWEEAVGLLHLRARWYLPETGTFLSVDPVESEPPYQYVRGRVVNRVDPSGMIYCDPVTGYCQEIERYLCSHTPGAYDHRGFPCIVDPNNVNTESPPPSVPWPIFAPPTPIPPPNATPSIPTPEDDCQCVKGQLNNGYSESEMIGFVALRPFVFEGIEIVFDFATLQIAEFSIHIDKNDLQPFPVDVGLFSLERVYDVNFISGFELEPRGNLIEEFSPRVVNMTWGLSGGIGVLSGQGGKHSWSTDDGTLVGSGYWYGFEASAVDIATLLGTSSPVGPEFSVFKNFTEATPGLSTDLGNVCNPENARTFLQALETWPYPVVGGHAGQYLGRLSAIKNFKDYANLD